MTMAFMIAIYFRYASQQIDLIETNNDTIVTWQEGYWKFSKKKTEKLSSRLFYLNADRINKFWRLKGDTGWIHKLLRLSDPKLEIHSKLQNPFKHGDFKTFRDK